jgi:2-hydroxy-6-oxonona-2,4-dienedioate hydrolase
MSFVELFPMRRIGGFLLAMSITIAATASVAFLLYKNELGRMRDAASRGSVVAKFDIGPIEYVDSGVGTPLLSIHGAGGGFDQGLAKCSQFCG